MWVIQIVMAANFTPDLINFKSSSSLLDIDPNMEAVNQFAQLNSSDDIETSHLKLQSLLGFSHDNFLAPVPEFPGNLADNFPGFFDHDNKSVAPVSEPRVSAEDNMHAGKKRKSFETPESSSAYSSPSVSENVIKRKNISRKGKRVKSDDKEEQKPKEVVHVRAKRGQATDSHSLAERVRRGKINERLKCLQSIVPGCYKTMGMAVMLDEIINYVQSLQNQVEFLSMKLTAASTFHDFNSETDIMDAMQRAKAYEAMKMQKLVREGHEGSAASDSLGPFDLSFGCYPPLPYSR